MGIRHEFDTAIADVLHSGLFAELVAAGLSIEGTSWNGSTGQVGVDFVSEPTAQDITDAQAVIDAHDPTDFEALAKQMAQTRLQNAKADFTALLNELAPLYDGLSPTARQNMIDVFTAWGNDPQSVTAAQKDNALGFATALFAIALDYLHRNGS